MNTMDDLSDMPASREVIRGAIRILLWIGAALLATLWAGELWRPLAIAMIGVQVLAAVGMAVRFTGVAVVDLLLVAVGYEGDWSDVATPAISRVEVLARILEVACLCASVAYLIHVFRA